LTFDTVELNNSFYRLLSPYRRDRRWTWSASRCFCARCREAAGIRSSSATPAGTTSACGRYPDDRPAIRLCARIQERVRRQFPNPKFQIPNL